MQNPDLITHDGDTYKEVLQQTCGGVGGESSPKQVSLGDTDVIGLREVKETHQGRLGGLGLGG